MQKLYAMNTKKIILCLIHIQIFALISHFVILAVLVLVGLVVGRKVQKVGNAENGPFH